MTCSHDGFTHTSRQFTTSLRTGVPQNRASVSLALEDHQNNLSQIHIFLPNDKILDLYQLESLILQANRQQILDPSKLKEFADDNFKFGENGRKIAKRVENTVGKGEIARYITL